MISCKTVTRIWRTFGNVVRRNGWDTARDLPQTKGNPDFVHTAFPILARYVQWIHNAFRQVKHVSYLENNSSNVFFTEEDILS